MCNQSNVDVSNNTYNNSDKEKKCCSRSNEGILLWKRATYIAIGIALVLQVVVRVVYSTSKSRASAVDHRPSSNNDTSVISSPACSVYVPGAGFSGFFFMLGRLQTLTTNFSSSDMGKDYYCFSAGCLGVVATMISNYTVDEVAAIAFQVQQQWSNGELSRYDLTQAFVDKLLPPHHDDNNEESFRSELLSKVNIITTVSSSSSTLSQQVRTARTNQSYN